MLVFRGKFGERFFDHVLMFPLDELAISRTAGLEAAVAVTRLPSTRFAPIAGLASVTL